MKLLRRLAVIFALLPASVAAGPYDDLVKAEVLHGWATDRGTHMAAIRLTLKEGWKTYWRSPGDAGIPPAFSWGSSRNIRSVAIHWPTPRIYDAYGLRTVGYKDSVTIPVEVTPAKRGQPVRIRARMELGVCADICVPATVSLNAVLDPSAKADVTPIRSALALRPSSAAEAGVGRVTCQIAPISDGLRLTAQIPIPRGQGKEVAMIELPGQAVWISDAKISRRGNMLVAISDIVPTSAQPITMNRNALIFTVVDGLGAVEIRGCSAG